MAPKMFCADSGVSDKNTPDSCDAFLPTCGRVDFETFPVTKRVNSIFLWVGFNIISYFEI